MTNTQYQELLTQNFVIFKLILITSLKSLIRKKILLALFDLNESLIERFSISNDNIENLTKAKDIIKKSLRLISNGRLALGKNEKTFICDRDYVI